MPVGTYGTVKAMSPQALKDIGFDGYAIGGLSVGTPEDLVNAVGQGIRTSIERGRFAEFAVAFRQARSGQGQ